MSFGCKTLQSTSSYWLILTAIIGDPASGLAECGMRLKSKAGCGMQEILKARCAMIKRKVRTGYASFQRQDRGWYLDMQDHNFAQVMSHSTTET